jgi:hypothetical protein
MLDTTVRDRQNPVSSLTTSKHLGEAEVTTVGPRIASATPSRREKATPGPLPVKEASEVATVFPTSLGEAEQTTVRRNVTSATPYRRRRRRATPLPVKEASEAAPFSPIEMESIIRAISFDNADTVNAFLGFQESGHTRFPMSAKNLHGNEPLYLAIQRATNNKSLPLDIVRSLLEHGADLEEPSSISWRQRAWRGTPKELALASGRDDLVALVKSHAAKTAAKHSKR